MFSSVTIYKELNATRRHTRTQEDVLLDEVKSILNADLIREEKVLAHLKHYFKTFELITEAEANKQLIFSEDEIKQVCIKYRLRFLDSRFYKEDYPYEAILKITDINKQYRKDLRHFKILAAETAFTKKDKNANCVLFALTNNGNYFLVHEWGGGEI